MDTWLYAPKGSVMNHTAMFSQQATGASHKWHSQTWSRQTYDPSSHAIEAFVTLLMTDDVALVTKSRCFLSASD